MISRVFNEAIDLPRSLRVRLVMPFVALWVAILVILYVFLGNVAEQTQLRNMEDDLHSQAEIASLVLTSISTATGLDAIVSQMAAASETRMTLIDASGNVLIDTGQPGGKFENHGQRPEVVAAHEGEFGADRRVSETTEIDMLYVAVPVTPSDGWVLRVAVPTTDVTAAVASTERAIAIAVMVSLGATVAASWYIAGRLARPLQKLMRQAMRMTVGDFSARVPSYDIREIDSVGRAFNRMAIRLEEVVKRQDQTSLRLELVMSGLIDGVVLTDEHGVVLRMNPAAEAMFVTHEQDAIGRPFIQSARDYEIARVLNRAFDGKNSATATIDRGVDHQAIQVLARVVEGAHERVGLVVLRDVSELRRLESVRREFVANVSHELHTPLTSIRALVETLEAGAIDEPEIAMDFLARIVGEIDRLNTMVEDLLDFARLESGRTPLRLEYADVGEVMQQGARRLQHQIERAGLTLSIELTENLPEMALDKGRIEQVLSNLIHNAIKYTPAGGHLTLRVWRKKNTVYVALRDTGVGVSEDGQSRLFERFYKMDKARHSEGTGLGLAIAQNIVRLHGGEISVESTPGEGSEFIFSLPIKRTKAVKRARKHTLRGLV